MIKQKTAGDCGIAALANGLTLKRSSYDVGNHVFNAKYNAVKNALGRDVGATIQELCSIIFDHGYLPVYLPFHGFHEVSGIEGQACQASTVLKTLGCPAILQVKSDSGLLHFVYFDGRVAHDPSNNVRTFRILEELYSVDAVLILDKPSSPVVPEPIEKAEPRTSAVTTVVINNTIDAQSICEVLESAQGVQSIMNVIRAKRL